MTDTLHEHADPSLHKGEPLVEMRNVGKAYGAIRALRGINLTVNAGEVACVLGDNGAGKSTLIKIISGLHPHNEGELLVDGAPVHFSSPRESLAHGIATVYQDLAVVGLMEVWRNFFLGSEMTNGNFPLASLKIRDMKRIADEELRKMGIVVNHFIILKLGQAVLDKKRSEVSLDELTRQMAGGDELTELSHELQR